jgi:hypothetical protein
MFLALMQKGIFLNVLKTYLTDQNPWVI